MSRPETEDDGLLAAARVKAVERDGFTVVRLRGFSPAMTFVAVAATGIFAVGFSLPAYGLVTAGGRMPAPLLVALGAAVLVLAALAARRRRYVIHSGREDLIIDNESGSLALPRKFGRRREMIVPFGRVVDVLLGRESPDSIVETGRHTWKRVQRRPLDEIPDSIHRGESMYLVVLRWRDEHGAEREDPIVRWANQRRAVAFADWLLTRIGR